MNNLLRLTAKIAETKPLRYTPAGVPVLDLLLQHESWQEENGQKCLVKFEMNARLLGRQAEEWQYRQNIMVEAEGFLAQRSQRFNRPILRIRNIQEYKG
ncbi:primosomal replication protein N [Neisseria chenwenguii]|uniref:Primosomal replication protein N n=1 Tax=Neisseria chenwenguii TaxID=1853278 RepID=A0A220RZZ5_9NEIS|nr:primosomal replication protein N [Neisseria chenwenguii]ASK26686.1 primosomal replication protein N [Neisseria chenwenguii]ROV56348.1 primosomal replication protein N [Neisseria chenwenguii]